MICVFVGTTGAKTAAPLPPQTAPTTARAAAEGRYDGDGDGGEERDVAVATAAADVVPTQP
jgi:hypothetical protein